MDHCCERRPLCCDEVINAKDIRTTDNSPFLSKASGCRSCARDHGLSMALYLVSRHSPFAVRQTHPPTTLTPQYLISSYESSSQSTPFLLVQRWYNIRGAVRSHVAGYTTNTIEHGDFNVVFGEDHCRWLSVHDMWIRSYRLLDGVNADGSM